MDKQFRLVATAQALGNRKGQVTVYSAIFPYRYGDNDPTVTSNDFIKALDALDVDEITVRINSPGGVITEAIAIRTALIKHPAVKRIDIEGACDSAATLIACMPGATVRMAKGSEYMIHRCSGGAYGNADKMMSAYNSMTQADKDMANIYAERTGKTEEECLALMKAETWYGAKEAIEAGFVDEIITGADDEEIELSACAVTAEEMELMKMCYEHVPEHTIREAEPANPVSNVNTAVAAVSTTENNDEGVNHMDELRNATAEQLQQENPTLAQTIANDALTAERNRVKRINALTRKGEKWQAMAKKAIEEGTSVEDYITAMIAEEEKAGADYLEARSRETAPAGNVGGGDSGDHDDDISAKVDKAAKDIAELAKDMNGNGLGMA